VTAPRLSARVLNDPPPALNVFTHPHVSGNLRSGIVHLGVGAFHRAHQALYTDAALDIDGGNWSIIGASLRSSEVNGQLASQDYLYTVVERENQHERFRLVGSIDHIIVAPGNPDALIDAMASIDCKIVSLTITEKGYCFDSVSRGLNVQHPDIVFDLAHPATPRSAPGLIVASLLQRYRRNLPGLSVMSCDNLPNNGQLTRQVVMDFASHINPDLSRWIDTHVSFPGTMVDRIVPATTESDRQQLEKILGYRDEGMVVCEPFSQWIIEDSFSQGRPAWENVGATIVDRVHDFETMKLRLLNGSHSALAYLGFLAGYQTVDEVMSDQYFVRFITHLMDNEITPTLTAPAEIDLEDYKTQLRQRFCNSALKHQTQQIAMDGSQKLPQRLLSPLLHQLHTGGNIDAICLAVAGWIRYTMGVDEKGISFPVADPLATILRQVHQQARSVARTTVETILDLNEVFPEELRQTQRFIDKTCTYLDALLHEGSIKTVITFVESH
jgi:fructuronate reductase